MADDWKISKEARETLSLLIVKSLLLPRPWVFQKNLSHLATKTVGLFTRMCESLCDRKVESNFHESIIAEKRGARVQRQGGWARATAEDREQYPRLVGCDLHLGTFIATVIATSSINGRKAQ